MIKQLKIRKRATPMEWMLPSFLTKHYDNLIKSKGGDIEFQLSFNIPIVATKQKLAWEF